MKKMFNLCLVAVLLSFGAACSKKTNSKAKEVIAKENALKAAQDAKDKLKAKEEKEKQEAAALKAKQENATELSDLLIATKDEEDSNIAFYQLMLAANINGSIIDTVSTTNTDAGADHDTPKEMSEIQARTGSNSEEICAKILKRLTKKADSDLVRLDRISLQRDVDGVVECRSLNLVSDYLEVSKVKALCEAANKKAAPAPKVEVQTQENQVQTLNAEQTASTQDQNDALVAQEEEAAAKAEEQRLAEEAKLKESDNNDDVKLSKNSDEKSPEDLRAKALELKTQAKEMRVKAETLSKKARRATKKAANALENDAKKLEKEAAKLESNN